MGKDKKKRGNRPGPLFTKIPGARVPKKEIDVPEQDKPICKEEDLLGIGAPDEPVIDLTESIVMEIKVDPDPLVEPKVIPKKKEIVPKMVPMFKKAPPPVFKDGKGVDFYFIKHLYLIR